MRMTSVPFVDLDAARKEMAGELEAAVEGVARSGRYLLGPELEGFEREFAAYCGTRHCVGVGSGLAAIELTLRAAGIGAGDEVIVPAYTWVATWLAVSAVGAVPVAVDVQRSTYNLDPESLAAAVTPRTAAILPVHLRGEPAEMEAIGSFARERGLFLLEDAAQAHGARHRGRRAGALGDAGAFSFYPAKNLGAIGDGGAVTTDDDELAGKLRLLRNYGMRDRYEIEEAGVNSRLAEVQAAVLRAKLPRLDEWNRARDAHARAYRKALAGQAAIEMPQPAPPVEPVWHLFMIGHPRRDALRAALERRGIETLIHYPTLPHRSGAYADGGWRGGGLPVADALAARSLSLPLYPQMPPSDREAVVEALAEALPEVGS
jgi:dTDP-3-amino-3,4,6-trideoxy-alpha-D-glucose transaminase